MCTLDESTLLAVLKILKVQPGHAAFLEAWLKTVFAKALEAETRPSATSLGRWLRLSSDLTSMEVGVTGFKSELIPLARAFVDEVGFLGVGGVLHMERVVEELQIGNLTLWCRLKRIGQQSASADAGFAIAQPLDWVIADLLMPPLHDQDLFRKQAEVDLLKPCMYSCSLFPKEPESSLRINIEGAVHTAAISCFFFFKALGFAKPEDEAMRLLGSCSATKCSVTISMGPKGLTRLATTFHGADRSVGEEVAESIEFDYKKDMITELEQVIGSGPDIVEFVAESRGFTVGLAFTIA